MLKIVALVCWAVSSVGSVWAQSRVQIDPSSQPAVNQLAAVAHAIKECPRELTSERKERKETERHYIGPPQNVVWDVVPSSAVRSPYVGYIEFSLTATEWDSSSNSFHIPLFSGPFRHRYEFDLGPHGLEIARMLHYGGPQLRTELFDDSPDDTCWQKAARNAHTVPQMVPPGFVAVPIGFATACAIENSGNYFLSWCDTDSDEATRQACKDWLHGFYTAFYKGLAANTVVACSSKVTDDELFNAVLKYLKDHPGDRDKRTGDLVVTVLGQAFPCKR